MLKAVCLIRRKAGLALHDFIHRYENGHAVLCAQLIPHMHKYVRRYVSPGETVLYEGAPDLDFDVVTELWFENRHMYEAAMAALDDSQHARLLAADEQQLFDVSSIRRFVVDERETNLER